MSDVTEMLLKIEAGDKSAAEGLLPLVYDQLRELASSRMFNERPDHTLQGTALVHEAYLRLVGSPGESSWENQGHFFAAAAEAMRRILIDSARAKRARSVAEIGNGSSWTTLSVAMRGLPTCGSIWMIVLANWRSKTPSPRIW